MSCMTHHEELGQLLEDAATRVDAWTGADNWTFESSSPAAAEVATAERRPDGNLWGERPVRTAYQLGQMATKFTVEMARCMAPLVRAGRPAPGVEALTRTSLEAGSVVWWLFEPGLSARQRTCRMLLLRRNSAREFERATLAIDGDPSVNAHESVSAVETYARELGLQGFGQKGDELEAEIRPKYTKRVESFIDEIGFKGAYNIYSGVAHAELGGLWRLLKQTSTDPVIYDTAPDPVLTRVAVHGALKAMYGSMWRISGLFGWTTPGRAQEVQAWISHLDAEIARIAKEQESHP
ncbi:hypothetical protein GCM10023346_04300 [Arthrobacter gyeryongensis]|uniref:Uncharacterized protein n=2 Tax=Arthrobacter TaxID=1663 RepID=A0ABP9RZM3_9MICC